MELRGKEVEEDRKQGEARVEKLREKLREHDAPQVKIEGTRGDQVAITSGINPGDEVVSSGVFRLRNGAPVQINNTVKPTNNASPKPEDS